MLAPGQEFAHFTILKKLGEGGMGAVYLAEDRKLGRRVAIKILPREFAADPQRLSRFQREARTAAQVSHANIMGIFDLGETGDPSGPGSLAYIVMQYVPGATLGRHLEDAAPDVPAVLRLAEKIASGLAAAHKLGIVHRDIKPENVIVTEDGEPVILDFGLAKPLEPVLQSEDSESEPTASFEGLTQAGRIVGTVAYMSPEQAQGEPVDVRSDVFSFGVLLFRMLTGNSPFGGASQVSVLAKIIEGTHPRPREQNPAIPVELERIIDTCLQKDPGARYQDTRDLVSDLRSLRRQLDSGSQESLAASQAGAPAARPAPRPRRRLRVAAAAAVVVLTAVVFVRFLGGRGGQPETATAAGDQLAILAFENKTGDAELAWMETGLPEILLTDLAQVEEMGLVSRERLEDRLRKDGRQPGEASPRDWREAGRALGAGRFLTGSYYKLGERIRIDARLEDSGGRILFAEKVVGEDAFTVVDSLTALVLAELDMAGGGDAAASRILTASTEAYRSYREGEEAFLLGRFETAREHYGQAVALDSTFALPYMRIGMSHVFQGRMNQGAEYFAAALQHQDRLPARERTLLDIYADLWLRQKYGDMYTKMESFVNTYPNDKEALSIYGALLAQFTGDTTRAYAHFERALDEDPTFPLALELYAQELAQRFEFRRAIVLVQRIIDSHPESVSAHEQLGDYYARIDAFDRAEQAYRRLLEIDPGNLGALLSLSTVGIRRGDLPRARDYAEEALAAHPGDAQTEQVVERILANLDDWEGRFRSALAHNRRAVELAYAMGDSVRIHALLMSLGNTFLRYEMPDSAVAAWKEADRYARAVESMRYPIMVVSQDPSRAAEMRPVFEKAVREFQASTPEPLWHLAESVRVAFDGYAERDTAKVIEHYVDVLKLPPNQQGGARSEAARLLVLTRRYGEAVPLLERELERNIGGWEEGMSRYLLGRSLEGLGRADEAIPQYRRVLERWGDADLDLEPVRESRARLQRLTS